MISLNELKEDLPLDVRLALASLEEVENELCAYITALKICGWRVSDICTDLKLSRFKVKKNVTKGLTFLRQEIKGG